MKNKTKNGSVYKKKEKKRVLRQNSREDRQWLLKMRRSEARGIIGDGELFDEKLSCEIDCEVNACSFEPSCCSRLKMSCGVERLEEWR